MSYLPSKISPLVEAEQEPWRKALMDAADKIRTHGWFQMGCGGVNDGPESICAAIAINDVVLGYGEDVIIRQRIRTAFIEHMGFRGWTDIMKWNDVPGRTKAEVIAALEDAALSRASAALVRV